MTQRRTLRLHREPLRVLRLFGEELVGGLVILRQISPRRTSQAAPPLTEEEQKTLDEILRENGSK